MKWMIDMFGLAMQQKALKRLASVLTESLASSRFEESGNWTWKREAGWKRDEIDLVVKGGLAQYILPSFRVRLPLLRKATLGETDQYVAQINVPRLLRPRESADYDVKVPALGFNQGKFIESTKGDIVSALPWFDEFKSPESAKANLERYLQSGCKAYADAVEYLDSLLRG